MRGKRPIHWLVAFGLLALAACGGDDSGSAGVTPASPGSGGLSAAGFPSSGGLCAAGFPGSGGTLAAGFPGSGGLSAAGPAPETLPLLNTPPAGVDAKLWRALTDALAREMARCKGASVARAAVPAFGSAALRGGGWRTGPSAPLKTSSAPPSGTGAVVGDLAITANEDGSAQFAWSFRSPGDYDQNGEVNLADLTPVGIAYGKTSAAADWARYEPADGDSNGEINLADVTPIGANFGNTLDGYELQNSATPAAEASWQPSGAEAALSTATTPPGGGRKTFALTIPAADPSLVGGTYFRVRGYIGSGAGRQYGQAGISVQFHGGEPPPPENQPPIAVLTVEPQSGLAPLDVLLDATGSGDIDGSIVKYEFDADGPLNGEEWTDMGPAGIMQFSYLGNGDFLCALRVTDDLGATDTDLALVKSRSANPPSAALTAALLTGPCPLHVVWDASTSADSDGLITRYEWDFDDDGEYEYDSGPVPSADFYYYEPGLYTVSLRVTDNDGLTYSGANQAEATDGAKWHSSYLPYTPLSTICAELLETQGRPGIFFDYDNGVGGGLLHFILGTDSEGSGWLDPVPIAPDLPGGQPRPATGIVAGRPAVASYKYFVLAQDAEGQAWEVAVLLPDNADACDMLLVEDKPLLYGSSGTGIVKSIDTLGTSFADPIPVYGLGWGGNLAVIGGKPALVTMDKQSYPQENLKFSRALDVAGTVWNPIQLLEAVKGFDPNLLNAGGFPAVAYYDDSIKAVKFIAALDAFGNDWGKPRVLYQPASPSLSSFFMDGRPAIVFQDSGTKLLMFMAANDAKGGSWSLPGQVTEDPGELGTWNSAIGAALISGKPSASFIVDVAGNLELGFAQYR